MNSSLEEGEESERLQNMSYLENIDASFASVNEIEEPS